MQSLPEPKSELCQQVLASLNIEQGKDENRANLDLLGGIDGLVSLIGVDLTTGLNPYQIIALRAALGDNEFPESPTQSYLEILLKALSDPTLIILIFAAAISLVIGIIAHPDNGWIEGVAIFIAVFLVSNISAGNDYTKQLQFRALEASVAKDERSSVLRSGAIERINPRDIVVGDVLVLQVKYVATFLHLMHHRYEQYHFSLFLCIRYRLGTPFPQTASSSHPRACW